MKLRISGKSLVYELEVNEESLFNGESWACIKSDSVNKIVNNFFKEVENREGKIIDAIIKADSNG